MFSVTDQTKLARKYNIAAGIIGFSTTLLVGLNYEAMHQNTTDPLSYLLTLLPSRRRYTEVEKELVWKESTAAFHKRAIELA